MSQMRRILLKGLALYSLVFPVFIVLIFAGVEPVRGDSFVLLMALIVMPLTAANVVTVWAIRDVIRNDHLPWQTKTLWILSFLCFSFFSGYLYLRRRLPRSKLR